MLQDAVLVIDPCTGQLDTTTYAGFGHGGAKWHGAAISDGLIYCVPFNGECSVLPTLYLFLTVYPATVGLR